MCCNVTGGFELQVHMLTADKLNPHLCSFTPFTIQSKALTEIWISLPIYPFTVISHQVINANMIFYTLTEALFGAEILFV